MNKIIYSIFFVFLILSCGNDNSVNEKELELKEKELEIRERKLALENEMASKKFFVDLDLQKNVRQNWPFFRDRRIDAYGDLTQRAID